MSRFSTVRRTLLATLAVSALMAPAAQAAETITLAQAIDNAIRASLNEVRREISRDVTIAVKQQVQDAFGPTEAAEPQTLAQTQKAPETGFGGK
ncbi:hypothetical protein [Ferrimonas balearica]|uniref:hypothetical protein n=1 Tax=Ferrimonas balearica TaxID=44012 RepID=UPI001C99D8F5|nr:hypothetical protein [Ferrimonas balearica]MBY5993734.1 hypothetical protein [Ferrimonas balearica]